MARQKKPSKHLPTPNTPTPFAMLLTDYMASKRPIWTTGRLARELGVRRQTIGNWLYHQVEPPIERVLTIMATLNIPISALLDAYRAAGIPTPTLDYPNPAGSATSSEARAASAELARGRQEEQRWEEMLEATRQVMTAAGFPAAALETMLASIQASRAGEAPLAQRRMQEIQGIQERADNPYRTAGPLGDAEQTTQPTRPAQPVQQTLPGAGTTHRERFQSLPRRQNPQPGPAQQSGQTGQTDQTDKANGSDKADQKDREGKGRSRT